MFERRINVMTSQEIHIHDVVHVIYDLVILIGWSSHFMHHPIARQIYFIH
jgi:hypothetical protein